MKSTPEAMPPASNPRPEARSDLQRDLAQCRADPHLMERLRAIYARLQAEIDAAGTQCNACGQCCRFDRVEHRLFVSTAELALLTAVRPPPDGATGDLRCAYQVAADCTARDRRPLGCRVFFCPDQSRSWCAETYEEHHRAVRAAHEPGDLPYRYVELTAALARLFPT